MIQSVQEQEYVFASNTDNLKFSTTDLRTRSASCQFPGWLNHNEGSASFEILNGGIYEVKFNANVTSGTAGQVALSNQAHLDSCCCELRAQGLENTQKILDALNQSTIQDLRDKLATANNQLSDQSVINAVRPYPVPSYLVSSPYSSIYNGFYGNGYYYGNAII